MTGVDYEEIEFVCDFCGRTVRMVKLSGLEICDEVCQRCSSEVMSAFGEWGDD